MLLWTKIYHFEDNTKLNGKLSLVIIEKFTPQLILTSLSAGFQLFPEILTNALSCGNNAQVNHILSAIKRKKSMDTIILSFVASVCTFLIFIYWLSKWGCILCRWPMIVVKQAESLDLMLCMELKKGVVLCFVVTWWWHFKWVIITFILCSNYGFPVKVKFNI